VRCVCVCVEHGVAWCHHSLIRLHVPTCASLFMWRDPVRTRVYVFALLALGVSMCIVPPRLLFTGFSCLMFTRHFRKRGGVVTMATKRFVEGLPVERVSEAIYSTADVSHTNRLLAGGTFTRLGDTSWRRRHRSQVKQSAQL